MQLQRMKGVNIPKNSGFRTPTCAEWSVATIGLSLLLGRHSARRRGCQLVATSGYNKVTITTVSYCWGTIDHMAQVLREFSATGFN